MKESYNFMIQLPFDDYAGITLELTEEEYQSLMEYNCDKSIWDNHSFEDLLSLAAVRAAAYIVENYCESSIDFDDDDEVPQWACTIKKLFDHLGKDEDALIDIMAGDSQYKQGILTDLLFEYKLFYLEED